MSYYQTEAGASTDQSFSARQQARYARRARLAEKEAKRQRVMEVVRTVSEALIGAFILYIFMFIACL